MTKFKRTANLLATPTERIIDELAERGIIYNFRTGTTVDLKEYSFREIQEEIQRREKVPEIKPKRKESYQTNQNHLGEKEIGTAPISNDTLPISRQLNHKDTYQKPTREPSDGTDELTVSTPEGTHWELNHLNRQMQGPETPEELWKYLNQVHKETSTEKVNQNGKPHSNGTMHKTRTDPLRTESPYDDLPIEEVFALYQETNNGTIRDYLIEKYLPAVKANAWIISERTPNNIDYEDLVEEGLFGLMEAIDRFDLSRNVKFETYSAPRIRGAILDYLREQDWVPRIVRERTNLIDRVKDKFRKQGKGFPTIEEIHEELSLTGVEPEKVLRDGNAAQTTSLGNQAYRNGDGKTHTLLEHILPNRRSPSPTLEISRNELQEQITRGLSRQEKMIVVLYYYEGLSMKEIGATLDLSESRVSQMHSALLERLRTSITEKARQNLEELAEETSQS